MNDEALNVQIHALCVLTSMYALEKYQFSGHTATCIAMTLITSHSLGYDVIHQFE